MRNICFHYHFLFYMINNIVIILLNNFLISENQILRKRAAAIALGSLYLRMLSLPHSPSVHPVAVTKTPQTTLNYQRSHKYNAHLSYIPHLSQTLEATTIDLWQLFIYIMSVICAIHALSHAALCLTCTCLGLNCIPWLQHTFNIQAIQLSYQYNICDIILISEKLFDTGELVFHLKNKVLWPCLNQFLLYLWHFLR